MIVNTDKFLTDYKEAVYEKSQIIEQRDRQIEIDTQKVNEFVERNNYPLAILPDFIERIKKERLEEYSTMEIDNKISFYETYIEHELEQVEEEINIQNETI